MLDAKSIKSLSDPGTGIAAFDVRGIPLGDGVSPAGNATLLVSPVSDALRRVSRAGLIEGEVNRDDIWLVAGFALAGPVVDSLEGDYGSPMDLYESVADSGYEWSIVPMPSGP